MAPRGCVREARGHLPAISQQRPPGLLRRTADHPPVRGERRKREAQPHRDRSASNAHARQSRQRQRAQDGSGRRYSLLIRSPREPRKRLSLHAHSNRRFTEMDIYAIVTEKIINLLESGVVPWRRPWTSTGLPRNLVSKKPYRGVNVFLLSASKYVSPFWLTMRQANELGGHVRKGEESTIVVFWKIEDATQSTEDLDNEETNEKARRRFLLRYYRVFNLEQCELPQAVLDKLPK